MTSTPAPSAAPLRSALAGFALLLVAAWPAQAQDTSRITRVTVYPGSATVERVAKVAAGARSLTLACLQPRLMRKACRSTPTRPCAWASSMC